MTRPTLRTAAVTLSLTLMLSAGQAGSATEPMPSPAGAKAQVLLLGTFHFANPGRDVVKTEQIDVLSEDSQAYLVELSRRLAGSFRPTVVLLEFDPENEAEIGERYRAYRAGEQELEVNEIYQLGFRIAAQAGLETVYSFDEREVGWEAGPLFEEMKSSDPETQSRFDAAIASATSRFDEAHRTMTLRELLLMFNDPQLDAENKSLYILTNHVGAGDSFSGADASASWWHRNFRMYAHIQQHAQPGERVLAIGGQGHIAILRDLLAVDPARETVDPRDHL